MPSSFTGNPIATPVAWPAPSADPPATMLAPGYEDPALRALFYENVPYRGRPTRVFAWLGLPSRPIATPCPGMVLLHGGGGTAFADWVRLWTARGYAAIAMDQCGALPPRPGLPEVSPRERHRDGGPPGWSDAFDQAMDVVEDQWPYHAVAAVLRARALLASQPGVDADRIGVTGISWGGYLTCLAAAVVNPFRFAIPVYGCGFLGYESSFRDGSFGGRDMAKVRRWLELWDASFYLPRVTQPVCWLSGTNDAVYPLPALQQSYRLLGGPCTLCIRPDMPHSHPAGWAPAEIGAFADGVLGMGPALPVLQESRREGRRAVAVFETAVPQRAELCFTRALGHWTDRRWRCQPARVDAAGRVEAELPPGTTAWYFNVFDSRGCMVSTPHECVNLTDDASTP